MKIELKNVKHSAFASQETNCFEATIYIDGKKACRVHNEGFGGPDSYEDWEVQKKIEAYAKSLPEMDISYMFKDGQVHTMKQSADTLVGELVENWIQKKSCANKIMFRIPEHQYKHGEWHTIKGKFTPEERARLVAKYGEKTEFYNDKFV